MDLTVKLPQVFNLFAFQYNINGSGKQCAIHCAQIWILLFDFSLNSLNCLLHFLNNINYKLKLWWGLSQGPLILKSDALRHTASGRLGWGLNPGPPILMFYQYADVLAVPHTITRFMHHSRFSQTLFNTTMTKLQYVFWLCHWKWTRPMKTATLKYIPPKPIDI